MIITIGKYIAFDSWRASCGSDTDWNCRRGMRQWRPWPLLVLLFNVVIITLETAVTSAPANTAVSRGR